MVQFGKRAVFVIAAVALIGVAGTAAAATMAAPQQHTPTLQKQPVTLGTQGEPVAQPVASPQHHGGCHWGMGDQSTKYQ